MLYILEMIGKGIGIGLLCILILLVTVLLALLFVPIRYRLQGKKEETGTPEGMVRVSWLFSLLCCFAVWEGKLHYGVKICGVAIFDNLNKGRRKKTQKKQTRKREKKAGRKRKPEETYKDEPVLPEQKWEVRNETTQSRPEKEPEETARPVQTGQKAQEGKGRKRTEKASIWDKLYHIWEKVLSFFRKLGSLMEKLLEFPGKLCKKTEDWQEKAEWYLNFFQQEKFRRAFALVKKQLLFLWRSIRPKMIRADIRLGFADPSVTGQVLAWTGMMYPFFGKTVTIRPDFEETVCSGKAVIKGRIILFALLRAALILYFNKDIRQLIHIWKKEDAVHDRQ